MSIMELGGSLRQFLLWVADRPRTYADAMAAWRTSCPRLSAWEDAMADDLIRVDTEGAASHGQAAVHLTKKGAVLLGEADNPTHLAGCLQDPAVAKGNPTAVTPT